MFRELEDNEILVRYFKREEEDRDKAEHDLWPTDFERRRKPAEEVDDNGISLARLIDGSWELPPKLKTMLLQRSGYFGFATARVHDLRNLGYKVIADNEFHVSLLCEFCNQPVKRSVLCDPVDSSKDCSLAPETDFGLRQILASRFKFEPAITL